MMPDFLENSNKIQSLLNKQTKKKRIQLSMNKKISFGFMLTVTGKIVITITIVAIEKKALLENCLWSLV